MPQTHRFTTSRRIYVDDKLFFAGEHTAMLECIGTMEAAAESGERIASAIIRDCQR